MGKYYVEDIEYNKKKIVTCPRCGRFDRISMEHHEPLTYLCNNCDEIFDCDNSDYEYDPVFDEDNDEWEDASGMEL